MSGKIIVKGNSSQSAGATGHGGALIIEGDASSRCGISMKGIDIIVKGSVGHMSAFMAQKGNLVIMGDADADLGDSIYEAKIFVKGEVKSLGADCIEKKMDKKNPIKGLKSSKKFWKSTGGNFLIWALIFISAITIVQFISGSTEPKVITYSQLEKFIIDKKLISAEIVGNNFIGVLKEPEISYIGNTEKQIDKVSTTHKRKRIGDRWRS